MLEALTCPKCGAPYRAESLAVGASTLHCSHCGVVFSHQTAAVALTGTRPRRRFRRPDAITVLERNEETVISWREVHRTAFSELTFTIGWNACLVFWFSIGLRSPEEGFPWFFYVLPIGHVAVGVHQVKETLIAFLDRTEIIVGPGKVSSARLPFRRKQRRVFESSLIRQVFCRAVVKTSDDSTYTRYSVNLRLADGTEVELLGDLTDEKQALFVEQCLESKLGITDLAVEGELDRT